LYHWKFVTSIFVVEVSAVSTVDNVGQKPELPVIVTCGIGVIVRTTVPVEARHGPPASGSLVVNESVTEPATLSAEEGRYVSAVPKVVLGLKVPVPLVDQVADPAFVIDPPSV
jgi:hypothetical protein